MKVLWILKMIVLGALAILGLSFITMHLWNYVVPGLFGLPAITFVQALALLVLSKLLFGGFRGGSAGRCGGHGGKRYWRKRMEEKLEKMTPEEREKFKSELRSKCGFGWNDAEEANTNSKSQITNLESHV